MATRAFAANGTEFTDPSPTEIVQMIESLGEGNAFLIIERAGQPGHFAQVAAPMSETQPDSSKWAVEYRAGREQYQSLTDDPAQVRDFLVAYAADSPEWNDQFDWKLILTHDD